MAKALVITPVKNAIENTLQTIEAILQSDIAVKYVVYNDFSDPEVKNTLSEKAINNGFEIIHLEDITQSPSPNYNLVLEHAQKTALELNIPLIVVESDVTVKKDTFRQMLHFADAQPKLAMLGAITVDANDEINFPYLKFKGTKQEFTLTHRSLSFCCTLMSVPFLQAYNFAKLDRSKDWYDTIISKQAIFLGFKNFILFNTRVLHKAHGSRPWKQLKYDNPLKYYWLKLINRRDKI